MKLEETKEDEEEEKRMKDEDFSEGGGVEVEVEEKEVFYEDNESLEGSEEREGGLEREVEKGVDVISSEKSSQPEDPEPHHQPIQPIEQLSQSDDQNDEQIQSLKNQVTRLDMRINLISKDLQKLSKIEKQHKLNLDHISKLSSAFTSIRSDLSEQIPKMITEKIKQDFGVQAIENLIKEKYLIIENNLEGHKRSVQEMVKDMEAEVDEVKTEWIYDLKKRRKEKADFDICILKAEGRLEALENITNDSELSVSNIGKVLEALVEVYGMTALLEK